MKDWRGALWKPIALPATFRTIPYEGSTSAGHRFQAATRDMPQGGSIRRQPALRLRICAAVRSLRTETTDLPVRARFETALSRAKRAHEAAVCAERHGNLDVLLKFVAVASRDHANSDRRGSEQAGHGRTESATLVSKNYFGKAYAVDGKVWPMIGAITRRLPTETRKMQRAQPLSKFANCC